MVWVADERREKTCRLQRSDAESTLNWQHRGATKAAVIGDSWSTGSGAFSWPQVVADELDLNLRVAAFGGSGYVNGSACGDQTFSARVDDVPPDAVLVIIAGGVNDARGDPELLADAARSLLDELAARAPNAEVFVLGVPRVGLIPDEETARADAALQDAVGESFIDVRGWQVDLLADRIHPSVAGHAFYGQQVAAAVRDRLVLQTGA